MGRRNSVVFELQVLNFMNAINFTPVFSPGAGAGIFSELGLQRSPGSYDPGGRLGQVVFRFNF